MKKLSTLLMMCLTATLAVAQTIEFEYKGNKIAPGSTLY